VEVGSQCGSPRPKTWWEAAKHTAMYDYQASGPDGDISACGAGQGCGVAQECIEFVEFEPTFSLPYKCHMPAMAITVSQGKQALLVDGTNACMRPELLVSEMVGSRIRVKSTGCPDHAYFQVRKP